MILLLDILKELFVKAVLLTRTKGFGPAGTTFILNIVFSGVNPLPDGGTLTLPPKF